MGDMGGQIDKMVSFIQFEAKNKREEILAKAKQDKEAKKLEVVHREKLKIDADFNKRIKNVDTQTKIKLSKMQGEMRMTVLTEADQVVNQMKAAAREEIAKIAQNAAAYKQLLEDLIVEAMIRMNETRVSICCRQQDVSVVQGVVSSAKTKFVAAAKASGLPHMGACAKGVEVTVDQKHFLPPGPETVASPDLPSCCGGVVIVNGSGTISCTNTLDARLDIAFEEQLPVIREKVFGGMTIC